MTNRINRQKSWLRVFLSLAFAVGLVALLNTEAKAQSITGTFKDWTVGQSSYADSVMATGFTNTVSWVITPNPDTLPAGLTIDSSGSNFTYLTFKGTPTPSSSYTFDVTASQTSPSMSFTKTVTLVINVPPTILTPLVLDPWTKDHPGYLQRLNITPGTGTPPFTWAETSPNQLLPTGLMLVDSIISDSPTVASAFSGIGLIATDAAGATITGQFSILINPALTFDSPPALKAWSVSTDSSYTETIMFSGGTGPLQIIPDPFPDSLAPGLNIDTLTGEITGFPLDSTFPGSDGTLRVTITDSIGSSKTGVFSYRIYPAPKITGSLVLPEWTFGHTMNSFVLSTADSSLTPTTWELPVNDTLFFGLNLVGNEIQGTPIITTGTLTQKILVIDGALAKDSAIFSLKVNNFVDVTTTSLASWTQDAATTYRDSLVGTGGTGQLTWSIDSGPFPPGLLLTSQNGFGYITGTPTLAGTYSFNVKATDAVGAASQSTPLSIVINDPLQITTGAADPPDATKDAVYSFDFMATGGTGTKSWSDENGDLGGTGLSFTSAGNLRAQNPTQLICTTITFIAKVIDQDGGVDRLPVEIKINFPPQFTTVSPVSLAEGQSMSALAAQDCNVEDNTLNFSLIGGTLPSGLTLNGNGTFSGTASFTSAGSYNVTLEVCETTAQLLCDTLALIVNVSDVNRAPVLATIATQFVQEGGSLLPLLASDPDPEDTSLIFGEAGCLPASLVLNQDGTFSGAVDFGTVPTGKTDTTFTCQVTVRDQDPTNELQDMATLTIVVTPDNTGPVISTPAVINQTCNFTVQVTDSGAGVDFVQMRWRSGNAAAADSGLLVTMTRTVADTNIFQGSIACSLIDSTGVELRFRAVDKRPNSPNETIVGFQTYRVPLAQGAVSRSRAEWLGGNDSLWHLVSFPLELTGTNNRVRHIFEELTGLPRSRGSADVNEVWRLVEYNPVTRAFVVLTSENQSNVVTAGKGYWFRHISQSFSLVMPAGNTFPTDPFPIALDSGWNLIGNPFLFPVTIDTLSFATQGTVSSLSGAFPVIPDGPRSTWQKNLFTTGSPTAQLMPFDGYAIMCESGSGCVITLDPHVQPPPPSPGIPEGAWETAITINSGGRLMEELTVGVNPRASDGPDLYDMRAMVFEGSRTTAALKNEEHGAFLRDIRSEDELQRWELNIDQAINRGYLEWGEVMPPIGRMLVLKDVVMDTVIDMTANRRYTIGSPGQLPKGRFVVLFGHPGDVTEALAETDATIPETYNLYQNYPNPFNPSTSIAFDVVRPGVVRVELFNVLGQQVRILTDRHFETGSHTIRWDGTSSEGSTVATGVYFARMVTEGFSKSITMMLVK